MLALTITTRMRTTTFGQNVRGRERMRILVLSTATAGYVGLSI